MDKIFDSHWALRITSLILAMALFFYVQSLQEDDRESNTSIQADVLVDVPLEVYYDDTNLIVSGLPETVDVRIEGPMSIVLQTKLLKDYKVFVNLEDLLIGKHSVTIQTENFSEKLDVTIEPETVNVTIEEKVTQEFKIEPELNNRQIADGYVLDNMEVSPQKVMVTGAKSIIDSISYVKANVKTENSISESFKQSTGVIVLNRDLNKLDVVIEPQNVEVAVNVKAYTRELPIVLEINGDEEANNIESLSLSQSTIVLTGPKATLDALEEVVAQIDVTNITATGEYDVALQLPEGVKVLSNTPLKAKATVSVDETVEQQTYNTNFESKYNRTLKFSL